MHSAIRNTPPPPIDSEVRRIRALMEAGEFAPALEALQSLQAQAAENRDVLYMRAVAQRYLRRLPDALSTLAQLEQHHPKYGRLFQERGHCHVAMRAAEPAIEAYVRAVTLNTCLSASWTALQKLFLMTGRVAEANNAADQVSRLAALPPAVVTAYDLYADGEVVQAEELIRRHLMAHGESVESMRLLAKIGMDLDIADDAELWLEKALAVAPGDRLARLEYAVVLLKRHKPVQARAQMEMLLELDPMNTAYRSTYATVFTAFGDLERALELYREVLTETPNDPELHLSIAHALKTLGRASEAIESYRSAAAVRPRYGAAFWSLANLKTYRFTDSELVQMRADEAASNIELADRYHLCFALGKALEDRAEYADSFAYYARGNALKRTESRYRPELMERHARLQASMCTPEFFAAREGWGCPDPAPIFIVGMPRSGSTLVEQILASHSQVEGTMELADIPRLMQELERRGKGDSVPHSGILAELAAEDFKRFGEEYLENTRVYRSGKPRFLDKMPNNFRHVGLIHLMLPNARIIHTRRDALACCFSNFKQLYAVGQKFSYSMNDIARHYRMYLELMAHWDHALPGKILRVQHEDLVEDLESQVRRILEFCELEFEPGCVEFHKTARRVHSPSSEQVRRPINREGVDQWRHYEPWLGALKEALGPIR